MIRGKVNSKQNSEKIGNLFEFARRVSIDHRSSLVASVRYNVNLNYI